MLFLGFEWSHHRHHRPYGYCTGCLCQLQMACYCSYAFCWLCVV